MGRAAEPRHLAICGPHNLLIRRGQIASQATFALHRPHFSRDTAALSGPAPHSVTIAPPSTVLADPQLPHSIFTLAPNRTRSAAVLICLVDIREHYGQRNHSCT